MSDKSIITIERHMPPPSSDSHGWLFYVTLGDADPWVQAADETPLATEIQIAIAEGRATLMRYNMARQVLTTELSNG